MTPAYVKPRPPRKTRTDAECRVLVAEAMKAAGLVPELFRYPTHEERERFADVVEGLAARGCTNAAIARVIGCGQKRAAKTHTRSPQ